MGEIKGRTFDLLTLGQVLLRLSPPDNDRLSRGDTFVKQVGGAELNVAVGASLLGLRTGVISKLPVSAMTFLCMTILHQPVWEFITMKTVHIRENQRLFMTV